MNSLLILQARMSSTRLPGKVLLKVLGKPLLSYLIERVKRAERVDHILIATSLNSADDVLEKFCLESGIDCYRGSEEDVLSRYYEAAKKYRPRLVLRATADCPLLSPKVIDEMLAVYERFDSPPDYLSNTQTRSYPRGMDLEIFPYKILERMQRECRLPDEREHVTPYIYHHRDQFDIQQYVNPIGDQSHLRLTVDVQEDFELIRRVLTELYPVDPSFDLKEIIELFDRHPDWALINQDVVQKKVR
jgi:spore coat polysaccharide biosynthesis protein SpsF